MKNDFNKIIRYNKDNNKSKIYLDLLKLKERKRKEENEIKKLLLSNGIKKDSYNKEYNLIYEKIKKYIIKNVI